MRIVPDEKPAPSEYLDDDPIILTGHDLPTDPVPLVFDPAWTGYAY